MIIRRAVAVLLLTASAVAGLSGVASARTDDVPGPCTDEKSLPEYCTDPNGGTGGDPEPKPDSDLSWFTNGDNDGELDGRDEPTAPEREVAVAPSDPAPQTSEHILLARQVGIAPVPQTAEYVDSWSNSDD